MGDKSDPFLGEKLAGYAKHYSCDLFTDFDRTLKRARLGNIGKKL
tara:strand:+ start:29 stop:163 length:135 start_codon:yes stop_codon:yes gene_type:complete